MKDWKMINVDSSEYIGIIEFQAKDSEWHVFEIVKTDSHLVFGGCTNIGLLESGNMEVDSCFSIDENLQELVADLKTYYNDGKEYTTHIVCNDRM